MRFHGALIKKICPLYCGNETGHTYNNIIKFNGSSEIVLCQFLDYSLLLLGV